MDKRTHILYTAQGLFAQFGLKKITTDEIAREAHVSKATVYKHYANKNEIFDEAVRDEADRLLAAIREAVSAETEVVGKLRAHLLTRLGRVHEFVNFYRVTQESWGEYWPYIARVREEFLAAEKDIVKEILRFGIETGFLHIRQIDVSAHALVVALASVEFQWSMNELGIPLPVLVDSMLEMMIEGIRKR